MERKPMINNSNQLRKLQSHNGYTLVELLVAIVLGVLITAAMVQTFLSSKQTFRVTEGVSRIQENARFALYFISQGVRDAGRSSCLKRIRNKLDTDNPEDYLSFKSPIQGWNYAGTESSDTFSLDSVVADPTGLPVSNWVSKTASGNEDLPAFLSGKVIKGSDVLSYKIFDRLPINLRGAEQTATGALVTNDEHGLEEGAILLVGTCNLADLFQYTSGNGSPSGSHAIVASQGGQSDPGNRNLANKKWGIIHTPNSKVFALQSTYYWIGLGANNEPSLFRAKSTKPLTAYADANVEELVEGVESLQYLFGEDTSGDSYPNHYISANEVRSWEAVVSMRVGLLFKAPKFAADFDQGNSYTLLDNITLSHGADDRVLRYAVNSTLKLRNRGLASSSSPTYFNAERDPGGGSGRN